MIIGKKNDSRGCHFFDGTSGAESPGFTAFI
jgi:hypothetical protein